MEQALTTAPKRDRFWIPENSFGVGGMISLTPFFGFQYLWTLIRIEPLVYRDEEPGGHPDWPSAENSFHRQEGGHCNNKKRNF